MTFLMTCTKLEENKFGFPEFGSSRVVGYYKHWNDGVKAMHDNRCDIWETIYEYGVLEDLDEGLYPNVNKCQFFKWNKEKEGFFEIETPSFLNHFSNLTIG